MIYVPQSSAPATFPVAAVWPKLGEDSTGPLEEGLMQKMRWPIVLKGIAPSSIGQFD